MKYGFLALGCLLIFSGCQNFQEPPISTTENLFESRKKDGADELLDNIKTLTVADAQRIALINNPDYKSAAYSVNAAKMAYYQALGAYSPTVSVGFSTGQENDWTRHRTNNSYSPYTGEFYTNTGINVNWVVFDGLARHFNAQAAKSGEKYQMAMEENSARLLLSGVVYAYNEILLAKANLKIAEEDMKFQKSSLEETELKHEVGTVPFSDVLNFKIRVNDAANSEIIAIRQYEVATYALAVLMGYPEGKLPDWITFDTIDINLDEVLPNVEVYLDTALANRPDLRAVREQLNIYKYNKYSTYSAFSPTVSLFATSSFYTSDNRYKDYSYNKSTYQDLNLSYGVNVNWTIFNGFIRYNQTREAQANEAIAKFNVASTWLGVVQEVREAFTNYEYSVKQAKLYEETLEYSTEQRDLVTKEYKAGTIGITRLNEVQNDLVDAESTLVAAYINSKNARIQLDTVSGIITKDYYYTEEAEGETPVKVDGEVQSDVQPVNEDGDKGSSTPLPKIPENPMAE